MNFEDTKLPHIRYIGYISKIQSKSNRDLYYLGGESDENHNRLTIGKIYELRSALYSPSSDIERVSVWICYDDESLGKVCQININNFGTFADLREVKINQIIE
jgi:hypothetical protein